MGQKVHPYGFRLGYTKPWKSRWFAERDYDKQLLEDVKLKAELKEKLKSAGVSSIEIERPGNKLRFGCKGIKVRVSGRLNGNEIARSEWYLQGRLPLHTLRADIEYGFSEAKTTYGVIGVKCWIYRGEILPQKKREGQPPVGTGAF